MSPLNEFVVGCALSRAFSAEEFRFCGGGNASQIKVSLFLFHLGAFTVEHLNQLGTVKDCVLIALVEGDGTVGTGLGAELAEHARAEVILILDETLLFLAVFGFIKFACHLDGTVGTCHLAEAATDALVLVGFVVGHAETASEAFEHGVGGTVLRILLGDFRREKFAHGGFETGAQTFQCRGNSADITFFFHVFLLGLSDFSKVFP